MFRIVKYSILLKCTAREALLITKFKKVHEVFTAQKIMKSAH